MEEAMAFDAIANSGSELYTKSHARLWYRESRYRPRTPPRRRANPTLSVGAVDPPMEGYVR